MNFIQKNLLKSFKTKKHRIAIFASGAGSNARKIIDHFSNHSLVNIALIISNKSDAGVLQVAKEHEIATLIIEKERFFNGDVYLPNLKSAQIDFIVLAGFLWKIPSALIKEYPNNIINIHPALLPKYGGKGMYGNFVHEAVINAKEKESGITIHFVDEKYDHGNIIFQTSCIINESDTPEVLAQKIHQLEHQYFPSVIEDVILKK